ncbi:NAD(P)-dependent oxidoreductase [Weissella confusa]|uniref:NAD(P)-dependent oxidoreductase n=1 Tax=Weissella confusa TaxID=1583 RepID=A0A923NHA3_WEICO|nr:NAD(P)-dependent oxidoreductase [Weissella confusa]
MVTVTIGIMAADLDVAKVMETLAAGGAQNWSLDNYGPRVLAGDFEPGFYAKHLLKDLRIALDEAAKMNLSLPATVAKNGTLTIMAGGDQAAYDSLQPIFDVISKAANRFGVAGRGQHTKMANQIMIAATMLGMSEMMVYATITMVGYPKDVEEQYYGDNGLFAGAHAGQIFVDMTTSTPTLAEQLATDGEKYGVKVLDAPVSGGDVEEVR